MNAIKTCIISLLAAACLLPAHAAGAEDMQAMTLKAEQGDAVAQLGLGLSYYLGRNVRDGSPLAQDYAQAVRWLEQSAKSGNSYAQWHLGGMYHEGKGVAQDDGLAARWFLEAARQGNLKARINIAFFYFEGTGVEQDFEKAFAWASLAAYRGDRNAGNLVRYIRPHIEDRDRAEELASEYFTRYGVLDRFSYE